MNYQGRFWQNWPKPFSLYFLLLVAIPFFGGLVLLYLNFTWTDYALPWRQMNWLEPFLLKVDWFKTAIHTFDFQLDTFLGLSLLVPDAAPLRPLVHYLYLGIAFASFHLIWTYLSYDRKPWIALFFGSVFVYAFWGSFNELFNQLSLIGVVGVYGYLSNQFQKRGSRISFERRLGIFFLVGSLILIALLLLNEPRWDFAFYPKGVLKYLLLLSAITVFVLAGVIPAKICELTSRKTGSPLRDYLVFSIINLLYLVYLYLDPILSLGWNIVVPPMLFVLLLSMYLGLRETAKHLQQAWSSFDYRVLGILMYLTFCAVLILTMTLALWKGNWPQFKMLKDLSVFAFLAGSISHLIYGLVNFGPMLRQKLPVYRAYYQPRVLPLSSLLLVTFMLTIIFMMRRDMVTVAQLQSAVYQQQGDRFMIKGQPESALRSYRIADQYILNDPLVKYKLGRLYEAAGELSTAEEYFEKSSLKMPISQLYAAQSEMSWKNDNFLKGLLRLKEGAEVFPEDESLQNDLGVFYLQLNMPDSAFAAFNKIESHPAGGLSIEAASVNKSFASAKYQLPIQEILAQDPLAMNNLLARSNKTREVSVLKLPEVDTAKSYTVEHFAAFQQFAINNVNSGQNQILGIDNVISQYPEFSQLLSETAVMEAIQAENFGKALGILSELKKANPESERKYDRWKALLLASQGDFSTLEELLMAGADSEEETVDSVEIAFVQFHLGLLGSGVDILTFLGDSSYVELFGMKDVQELQSENNHLSLLRLSLFGPALENSRREMLLKKFGPEERYNLFAQWTRDALNEDDGDLLSWLLSRSDLSMELRQKISDFKLKTEGKELSEHARETASNKVYSSMVLAQDSSSREDLAFELAEINPYENANIRAIMDMAINKDIKYEILSKAVQVNGTDPMLWELFIGEALDMNLLKYADSAWESYQQVADHERVSKFRAYYRVRRDSISKEMTEWDN